MTALSAERATSTRNEGNQRSLLMADDSTIYAGSLVMIDADGLAASGADTASVMGVVGLATETVVNPASGGLRVVVVECEALIAASSVTQAMVGSLTFCVDDQTVDETTTNSATAGMVTEYVSTTSLWVALSDKYLT